MQTNLDSHILANHQTTRQQSVSIIGKLKLNNYEQKSNSSKQKCISYIRRN